MGVAFVAVDAALAAAFAEPVVGLFAVAVELVVADAELAAAVDGPAVVAVEPAEQRSGLVYQVEVTERH